MDDLKERLFHLFQLIAPGLILQSIPNSSFHIIRKIKNHEIEVYHFIAVFRLFESNTKKITCNVEFLKTLSKLVCMLLFRQENFCNWQLLLFILDHPIIMNVLSNNTGAMTYPIILNKLI